VAVPAPGGAESGGRRLAVLPLLAGLAVLILLAGCDGKGGGAKAATGSTVKKPAADASFEATAATPSPSATPDPLRSVAPAAAAGGICRQFTFDRVASVLGERFEVAAASGKVGSEQVCVLQRVGVTAPDLTFSKLPLSAEEKADPPADATPAPMSPVEAFRADYQPKIAKNVSGIGRAAYSRVVAGSAGAGPLVEVGWLGTANVFILSHTTAPGTSAAVAAKRLTALTSLARELAG
jgi:hypothetical protein